MSTEPNTLIELYSESINQLEEDHKDPVTIEVEIPGYIYQMISEVAENTETSQSSALVQLIRTGHFIHDMDSEGLHVVIEEENPDGSKVATQINFE